MRSSYPRMYKGRNPCLRTAENRPLNKHYADRIAKLVHNPHGHGLDIDGAYRFAKADHNFGAHRGAGVAFHLHHSATVRDILGKTENRAQIRMSDFDPNRRGGAFKPTAFNHSDLLFWVPSTRRIAKRCAKYYPPSRAVSAS